MLDEQLQTAFRFSKRAFLNSVRDTCTRRVYVEDHTGWFAGWVPRYRHGVVQGAVPPDGDSDSDDETDADGLMDGDTDADNDADIDLTRASIADRLS